MKYSIKFYPEKRKGITENLPINMSVIYSGLRMFFYTGKRCHVDQWDTNWKDKFGNKKPQLKKNQVPINGQTAQEFMADLDRIKIAVDDLFKIYDVRKVVPTTTELREDLKIALGKKQKNTFEHESFFKLFDDYKNRGGLSDNSVEVLNQCINWFKKYDPNATFEKLSLEYFEGFYKFMLLSISRNSALTHLKRFKSFLNYSYKNKIFSDYGYKSFPIDNMVYGDPIYLTLEERDIIFNADIENPTISLWRDIFVLQSCIGCRYSDLMKLNRTNIIDNTIEYIAIKTKNHESIVIKVPLIQKALVTIKKYDLPDGRLVPFRSISGYDLGIKRMLIETGITRLVTIPDRRTRQSKQVRICDIASSHMARRIFIGGLIKKNVLIPVISSMSGHCDGSRALNRYFHIDRADQKSAIALME
jgi:integrase